MSRPKKKRMVYHPPIYTEFKPVCKSRKSLNEIVLSLDEYEAIRLVDNNDLDHEEASREMEISRSTLSRLIDKAHKKVADFLIEGKLLLIDGGDIHFRGNIIKCAHCGYMFNTNFDKSIKKCPSCQSEDLFDLAGGFGHGKCCKYRNQNEGR